MAEDRIQAELVEQIIQEAKRDQWKRIFQRHSKLIKRFTVMIVALLAIYGIWRWQTLHVQKEQSEQLVNAAALAQSGQEIDQTNALASLTSLAAKKSKISDLALIQIYEIHQAQHAGETVLKQDLETIAKQARNPDVRDYALIQLYLKNAPSLSDAEAQKELAKLQGAHRPFSDFAKLLGAARLQKTDPAAAKKVYLELSTSKTAPPSIQAYAALLAN